MVKPSSNPLPSFPFRLSESEDEEVVSEKDEVSSEDGSKAVALKAAGFKKQTKTRFEAIDEQSYFKDDLIAMAMEANPSLAQSKLKKMSKTQIAQLVDEHRKKAAPVRQPKAGLAKEPRKISRTAKKPRAGSEEGDKKPAAKKAREGGVQDYHSDSSEASVLEDVVLHVSKSMRANKYDTRLRMFAKHRPTNLVIPDEDVAESFSGVCNGAEVFVPIYGCHLKKVDFPIFDGDLLISELRKANWFLDIDMELYDEEVLDCFRDGPPVSQDLAFDSLDFYSLYSSNIIEMYTKAEFNQLLAGMKTVPYLIVLRAALRAEFNVSGLTTEDVEQFFLHLGDLLKGGRIGGIPFVTPVLKVIPALPSEMLVLAGKTHMKTFFKTYTDLLNIGIMDSLEKLGRQKKSVMKVELIRESGSALGKSGLTLAIFLTRATEASEVIGKQLMEIKHGKKFPGIAFKKSSISVIIEVMQLYTALNQARKKSKEKST